jgi:hypothetical protein
MDCPKGLALIPMDLGGINDPSCIIKWVVIKLGVYRVIEVRLRSFVFHSPVIRFDFDFSSIEWTHQVGETLKIGKVIFSYRRLAMNLSKPLLSVWRSSRLLCVEIIIDREFLEVVLVNPSIWFITHTIIDDLFRAVLLGRPSLTIAVVDRSHVII